MAFQFKNNGVFLWKIVVFFFFCLFVFLIQLIKPVLWVEKKNKNNGEEGKLLLCLLPQLKTNIHVYAQLHGLFKRSWIWKGRMDLMKQ